MRSFIGKSYPVLLLLLFIFLLAGPLYASADVKFNNQIKGSGTSTSQSLFYSAGNARKIEQPGISDYYSSPFAMYIDAPKGHSVFVYDYWSFNESNRFDAAFHGSRVIVLAKHGDFFCILYHTQANALMVAWINSEHVVSYYPGNSARIGLGKGYVSLTNVGDPEVSWSRENFIGTGRKYTLLDIAVKNVVSFTLDYQITARNGSQSYEVTGLRDVYVNDGSGWLYIGSFDYPDHQTPVHVTVTFSEPMTLAAVATVPNCTDPTHFVFRQCVLDVMCCSGSAPTAVPTEPPAPRYVWSQWSGWSTTPVFGSATREVETRQNRAIVGYNMVHYGTQQLDSPHYRMFRDYSIKGNFDRYGARYSYGEKHLTKYVSASQMNTAASYPANGYFVSLIYNGDSYEGFQMGTTTAYNFGDDNKVWFIESEKYSVVTEYRYRNLIKVQ